MFSGQRLQVASGPLADCASSWWRSTASSARSSSSATSRTSSSSRWPACRRSSSTTSEQSCICIPIWSLNTIQVICICTNMAFSAGRADTRSRCMATISSWTRTLSPGCSRSTHRRLSLRARRTTITWRWASSTTCSTSSTSRDGVREPWKLKFITSSYPWTLKGSKSRFIINHQKRKYYLIFHVTFTGSLERRSMLEAGISYG